MTVHSKLIKLHALSDPAFLVEITTNFAHAFHSWKNIVTFLGESQFEKSHEEPNSNGGCAQAHPLL